MPILYKMADSEVYQFLQKWDSFTPVMQEYYEIVWRMSAPEMLRKMKKKNIKDEKAAYQRELDKKRILEKLHPREIWQLKAYLYETYPDFTEIIKIKARMSELKQHLFGLIKSDEYTTETIQIQEREQLINQIKELESHNPEVIFFLKQMEI